MADIKGKMIMCAGEPASVQGLTPDADSVAGGMKYPSSCGYIELRRGSTDTICVAWTELVPAKQCSSVGKSNNQCVALLSATLVCEEKTSERQGAADLLPIDLHKKKPLNKVPYTGVIKRRAIGPSDSDYYIYYDGKMLTCKPRSYKKHDDGFYFKLDIFLGVSRPLGKSFLIVTIKPKKKSDSNHGEMVLSADSTVVKAVVKYQFKLESDGVQVVKSYSTSGVENVLNRGFIPKEDPNSCMLIYESEGSSAKCLKFLLMSLDPQGCYLKLDRHGKLEVAKSPEEPDHYCVFDMQLVKPPS